MGVARGVSTYGSTGRRMEGDTQGAVSSNIRGRVYSVGGLNSIFISRISIIFGLFHDSGPERRAQPAGPAS